MNGVIWGMQPLLTKDLHCAKASGDENAIKNKKTAMTYLNPRNGIVFWCIFGDPTQKERGISLLNSLLPLGEGCQIVDIEFQQPDGLLPVIKPMLQEVERNN